MNMMIYNTFFYFAWKHKFWNNWTNWWIGSTKFYIKGLNKLEGRHNKSSQSLIFISKIPDL